MRFPYLVFFAPYVFLFSLLVNPTSSESVGFPRASSGFRRENRFSDFSPVFEFRFLERREIASPSPYPALHRYFTIIETITRSDSGG